MKLMHKILVDEYGIQLEPVGDTDLDSQAQGTFIPSDEIPNEAQVLIDKLTSLLLKTNR